jgi:hypothetical protein
MVDELCWPNGGRREIIYADVDRQLRLRTGATRDHITIVAQRLGYELTARGPNVALVHRPRVEPAPSFLATSESDGWFLVKQRALAQPSAGRALAAHWNRANR